MIALFVLFLLIPIALVVGLVVAVTRAVRGRDTDIDWGEVVRQFFQHLIAVVLGLVAAGGLSDLVRLALEGPGLLQVDETLAVPVAFTVIGVPLYVAAMWWLVRRIADDVRERESAAWGLHVAVMGVVSLVYAMVSAYQLADWALDGTDSWPEPTANLVVWGGLWVAYRTLERTRGSRDWSTLHVVAGSAIGLVTAAVALQQVLTAVLDGVVFGGSIVDTDPMLELVVLGLGVMVWTVYWLLDGADRERDAWWYGWVLLGPMLQGLLILLGSVGYVVHTALVWFLGDPGTSSAGSHFVDVPAAAAGAIVAALVWVLHRTLLPPRSERARTEVDRVHDLLLAGVGLLAAAGGFATVFVAIVEAVVGPGTIERGTDPVNTLLAALTLLALGGPVWWRAWSRTQRIARMASPSAERVGWDPTDPGRAERHSPSRRVYLFALFGISGLAAVGPLLVGVVDGLEDLFSGRFGAQTIYSVRISLAILLTAGAVAVVHWSAWRGNRERTVDREVSGPSTTPYPRRVTLVGVPDAQVVDQLRTATGSRVELWQREDGVSPPWNPERVATALSGHGDRHVLVVSSNAGLEIIPVES